MEVRIGLTIVEFAGTAVLDVVVSVWPPGRVTVMVTTEFV